MKLLEINTPRLRDALDDPLRVLKSILMPSIVRFKAVDFDVGGNVETPLGPEYSIKLDIM
jgi:hypothetical protein